MNLWPLMEEKLLKDTHPVISLTGGGGKTTFLILFSQYLRSRGKSVLMTTTTKLASPETFDYRFDRFFSSPRDMKERRVEKASADLFASKDEKTGKLISPGENLIMEAGEKYDVVLIEADGSKRLPLKIHTSRDPVIITGTTGVVSITGGWGVGEKARDVVFTDDSESVVDREYLENYLLSSAGPLKGMEMDSTNIILFNGGDALSEYQMDTISSLVMPSGVDGYIVSERKGIIYHALQHSR